MTLTPDLRASVECCLATLLEAWGNETYDPPALMLIDLDRYPALDEGHGFNWTLGHVTGIAKALGVPTEELLAEIDPDWGNRCPHGGLPTGPGGCPECA